VSTGQRQFFVPVNRAYVESNRGIINTIQGMD